MSKHRVFSAVLLALIASLALGWGVSSAAPSDQEITAAATAGPQENVSNTGEESEAPQAATFGNSVRVVWGERDFDAVVYSEKEIGASWPRDKKYFEEQARVQYEWPDIAVAPDGTTHIVYAVSDGTIYHRSKPNNGSVTSGWSDRHKVGSDTFPNPTRIAIGPDGALWIIWRDANGTTIKYRRSTDGGLTWSGGEVVSTNNNARSPDIAIGPNNVPHVVWYYNDNNGSTARYADWNGSGWNIGAIGGGSGYVADPVVAVDPDNVIHVAYRRNTGDGGWTIQHAFRTPGGNWTQENVGKTSGDAGYSPAIATDSASGVHVTWSSINGSGRDVYYNMKPAGGSFGAAQNVSENSGGWNSRSAITTITKGNQIIAHVFYQRGVRGSDVDEIYYRTFTSPNPKPVCEPITVPAPANPQPLGGKFRVFLPIIWKC